MREIESGTYRRDLQKAYRRIAARGAPLTEAEAGALGIPAARAQAFVAQQNRRWGVAAPKGEDAAPKGEDAAPSPPATTSVAAAPATVPSRAGPPPAQAAPASPSPEVRSAPQIDLREIHRAYTEAHARLSLPGPPPTAEHLRDKVLPRLERLRAENPAARLRFDVVSENGRIVIRAKTER
jgi:hypothetical protein